MKYLRKRLAIILCMIMAISAVTAYVPTAQETVEAKDNWEYGVWGSYGFGNTYCNKISQFTEFLNVEKGNKTFKVSDLMGGYRYSDGNDYKYESFSGESFKDAKYESKNPDIVSIDAKTGKINAKKKGTALIKVTWHGVKSFGVIKVVDPKEMKKYQKENKALIEASKKMISTYGKKITSSNVLDLIKQNNKMNEKGYWNFVANVYEEGENWTYTYDYYVYSMDAFNASKIRDELSTYCYDRTPFSTQSKYKFKISSLSGSGKEVTATLSKAVSDDQYIGALYAKQWAENYKATKDSVSFDMYVCEPNTYNSIHGIATIKKGSKEIKIKLDSSLSKGKKYDLCEWEGWIDPTDWIHEGKGTFTAK